MADRPIQSLGWKTPLQSARKRNMDILAQRGVSGIMDVLSPGVPPGSDTAHLAIFGYDPYNVYRGRGAFEALGVGVSLQKGDIAFRCNLATVDATGQIIDRRAGRIDSVNARTLAKALRNAKRTRHNDVEVIVEPATEHRIAIILRGDGLSSQIGDTDPHEAGMPVQKVKPLIKTSEAAKTADIVNDLSTVFRDILEKHPINQERKGRGDLPANAILFRGASELPKIEPLPRKYGVRIAAISGTALIKGVCRSLGIEIIEVKGATGTLETDVEAKAEATIEALHDHEVVYTHVKGTDNASHDGDVSQKVRMIERIDQMIGNIASKVDQDTVMSITTDHTTPVETKEHTGDPVPVTISGQGVRRDGVKNFDEISCAKGGLNKIRGIDLFPILMNSIGRTKKFGA